MKFNFPINNFAAGEWSPKMGARTETEQYFRACESLKNAIVQMQGGAFRRPGTAYINIGSTFEDCLDSTDPGDSPIKTIPVLLSTGERFILVCTREAPSAGANKWFSYNVGAGTCAFITSSTMADFSSSTISTTHYAQVGDRVFIVNEGTPPRFFAYNSDTLSWSLYCLLEVGTLAGLGTVSPWETIPYGPIQTIGIDGTITATGTFTVGGTVTLTSSIPRFHARMADAVEGAGLGIHYKLTAAGNTGVVRVTAFTSATSVTAEVVSALPGSSPTTYGTATNTAHEKGMWNGHDGYPRCITSYQGRIICGGSRTAPDTLWGSRIGNVYFFMEAPFANAPNILSYTSDNSRPFTLVPTAANGSAIKGLSAAKTLVINTDRCEIVSNGTQGSLGANDFYFESSSSFGTSGTQPFRINNFLTFVQRGGRKIRDLLFAFEEGQYKSNDLGFVADHLTPDGDVITEMTAAELTSSVMFCRTYYGRVLALTLDRDYQVNAWSPLVFGGSYSGIFDDNHVECLGLCAVANTTGADDVFFVLRRTINGLTKTYLEQLSPAFESENYGAPDDETPFYMDSMRLSTSTTSALLKPGFSHLVGQEVGVLADGVYIGQKTVNASGEVELDLAASYVHAGLLYETVIRPMPIEQGAQSGTSMGSPKRITDIQFKFYKTLAGSYGMVGQAHRFDINFRDPTLPSTTRTPLFTGVKNLKLPATVGDVVQPEIRTNLPYPCNVLSITLKGNTNDQG